MTFTAPERGTALIEFALLMTTLLLMILGVFDFGLAVEQAMAVSSAARAGAGFGASEGNANNTTGMQNAAVNAVTGLTTITATATTWCTCTAGGTTVSCSSTCNTYDVPIQYVQVQTSATLPVLFRFSTLPLTIPLSGNSIMRVR